MVTLGIRNSRIKDFFDIHYLASHFDFDGPALTEAVRRTFRRRKTPFPAETPIALTVEFWDEPGRAMQLKAFARRARLDLQSPDPTDILPLLADFLVPLLRAVGEGTPFVAVWKAGGPWR